MTQLAQDRSSLTDAARRGDMRAIGRVITDSERGDFLDAELMSTSQFLDNAAHVIGFTGAPGVGKSTTLAELIRVWRALDKTVAVLAIDPTSQNSGGAVLGDRARMTDHALDPGVFIRSMAARGHLGGLSRAVPQAVQVLMVAGFDVIAIETVGVGQSEVDVAALADTTCVLLAPGMGDSLQAVKAGVMEIADLFIVTKADLPGSADVTRNVRTTVGRVHASTGWPVKILTTSAAQHAGFDDVAEILAEHRDFAAAVTVRYEKLKARRRRQIVEIAIRQLESAMASHLGGLVDELVDEVCGDSVEVGEAAGRLLAAWHAGAGTSMPGSATGSP